MQKLISSLKEHQVPNKFSRDDWTVATRSAFVPYFRRQRQLTKNIDSFHIELRNFARIAKFPEYTNLLFWCLRLHRRVIRKNRQEAYENLIKLIANKQASDDRWLNMFETSAPLEADAAIQDRVYQLFSTIDGVAEGCFKHQFQILFSFAQKDSGNPWPSDVTKMDFGALVTQFPNALRGQVPVLFADPDLSIPINQWRNIAAHKTFQLVGPRTIEIEFGKGTPQVHRLGFHRLRKVWHWLLRIHTATRLANTIIYIEHMPELHALGLPSIKSRLSSTLLNIIHGLSTVGFEAAGWQSVKRDGILSVRDRLGRPPRDALIHASQMLGQISVGILLDPSTKNRFDRAGISLVLEDGSCFGTALVPVQIADAFTRSKVNLKEYMETIQWIV
jgi:hypothetical protein